MDPREAARDLLESWRSFYDNVPRPAACLRCYKPRVTYDGSRFRSASVLVEGAIVHLSQIPCRRVKCGACSKSWVVYPPGLSARRHYQLDVVAQAAADHLFKGHSEQRVAETYDCSRRTVGRWLRWLSQIACPAELQRQLVEQADAPIQPSLPAVADLDKSWRQKRSVLLTLAAAVLCLFEALGSAMGVAPPGVQGVLERVLWGRAEVATYAAPLLPDFAPSPGNRPGRS